MIQGLLAGCEPIPQDSICAPFQGSIDTDKLSQIYGQNITISNWAGIVRDQTIGGQQQQKIWSDYYKCPSYKGELIQYYRSFVCMTDLYVYSGRCNKEKVTPVCPEVCDQYSEAVQLMLSKCPTTDRYTPAVQEMIDNRRTILSSASSNCHSIRTSAVFDQKQQCMVGILSDQTSCGFGGNQNVAKAYCEKNEKSTCCSGLVEQRTEGSMDYVQRIVMMMGATSPFKAGQVPSMQTTLFIIGGVCAAVVLLGIGIAMYVKRRAKNVKQVEILSPSKEIPHVESNGGLGLKCIVKYDYQPNLSDEMELRVGDVVIFDTLSDDAWGDARNLTSGEVGKACTRFMEPIPN